MKNIVILGSTGSIGRQTLEVIDQHPQQYKIVALSARRNVNLLYEQAKKYSPEYVVITDGQNLLERTKDFEKLGVKVLIGYEYLNYIVSLHQVDLVVAAMVGFSGLLPTISAIMSGKDIALANKETLVVAGELVMNLARSRGVKILPVDSEHSAIFQCLEGERNNPIDKIYLTASGGPFRGMSKNQLKNITKEQALKHPNWSMGNKITIDSATLMNKGLEAIEAHWLFAVEPEKIDILIHPQSIIHSMVQFVDGSIKAQLGLPDMRLPIQYALTYPERMPNNFPRIDFTKYSLTFEEPDLEVFSCLRLALNALKQGGNMPCVLNAANEVAVEAFLADLIKFLDIASVVEYTMEKVEFQSHPKIDDYIECDAQARRIAQEYIKRIV